jgi:hypothetical protein
MSRVIDFYAGIGADHRGRTIDEILARDDEWLEHTHDYIQWLFPLTEPSRFNPHAPLLTDADRTEFNWRPELRANMVRTVRRMLQFYGFAVDESGGVSAVRITPVYAARRHWLSPGDHNYLRITRILTSLKLVGMEPWAAAFFEGLSQLYRQQSSLVGSDTFSYWQRAAKA